MLELGFNEAGAIEPRKLAGRDGGPQFRLGWLQ